MKSNYLIEVLIDIPLLNLYLYEQDFILLMKCL